MLIPIAHRRSNDLFKLVILSLVATMGNAYFSAMSIDWPLPISMALSGAYLVTWLVFLIKWKADLPFLKAAMVYWVFCGGMSTILAVFVCCGVNSAFSVWSFPMLALEFLYGMPTVVLRHATQTYGQYRLLSAGVALAYCGLCLWFLRRNLPARQRNR